MITATDIIVIIICNTIGSTIGSIAGYFIASMLLTKWEKWKE